jgi:hypothetical protein
MKWSLSPESSSGRPVLAADITGRWDVTISTPDGRIVGVASFTQKGQVVTGWLGPSESDPIPISIALNKRRLTIWTHPQLGRNVAFARCDVKVEKDTKSNETIKDQLTNQTWDRQRQWEMKRDAVLAVVPSLGRTRDALMYLAGLVSQMREDLPSEWQRHPKLAELSLELIRRLEEFDEKRLIASFLCSDELATALDEAGKAIRSAISTIKKEEHFSMSELFPPVRETVSTALLKAREEIGL